MFCMSDKARTQYRVVAYVLNGQYKERGYLGTRDSRQILIDSEGSQYAVVQRSDGKFVHCNVWEMTTDGLTVFPHFDREVFDDEDAAIVAACMKSL